MSGKVIFAGGRQQGKTAAALARLARTLRAQEESREAMEMAFLCAEFGMSLFGAGLATQHDDRLWRTANEIDDHVRLWADPVIGKRSMGEMLAAKRWESLRTPCV